MSLHRPTAHYTGTVLYLVASLVSTGAIALEWSAEPSISVQEIYNDNIQLTTAPHESVTGTILSPKLDLAVGSEIWDIRSSAQFRDSNYSGVEGLDGKDQIYNLSSSYRTPRSQWQLSGSSAKESLLAGETINPDIGLVRSRTQRDTKSGALSFTYSLTETTRVSTSYQNIDAVYAQGSASGQFDYQQDQVSLTVSEQYSERAQVFVTGGFSKYKVPANQFASETTTARVGVTYNFDETVKLTLSGGIRKTSSQGVLRECQRFISLSPSNVICALFRNTEIDSVNRGSVYDASLEKQFEASNLSVGYNRDISSSSSGAQVETNTLSVALQRPIDSRNSLFFNTAAYRTQSLETTLSNTDRRYYQAESGWRWRCTEACALDLSYRYAYQKYLNANESAKSNALILSLTYILPKLSVSR